MPDHMSHPVMSPSVEVLVVDDELETTELLSEFCRRQGLGVAVAQDGRSAITAIERDPSRFAVVITDLHLPGADGFAVLKAAREANPSCYVVIITGYATIDSAVRAVRSGAYDYLAKPFALGQLEIILRRIEDRMALERENRALLTRQAHGSGESAQSRDLLWRLDGIEERLARIELLLREKR
jgi:two-component system, NtrC family, response regulator HydG